MRLNDLVDEMAEGLNRLPPRRRAAVFWLVGTGLRSGLDPAEDAEWGGWFDEASRLSVGYIIDGWVSPDAEAVWARGCAPTGKDASQQLESAIVTLCAPLDIAMNPQVNAGPWLVHALFPVVQKVSLELFDDVAFPDDEDLDDVCADRRVRAAGDYCLSVCETLRSIRELDQRVLEGLLKGASALNG